MKITTSHNVEKCSDCPHVTNSSKLHDCAFTSAPHPVRWYCIHEKLRDHLPLYDERVIHKHCPELKPDKTPKTSNYPTGEYSTFDDILYNNY